MAVLIHVYQYIWLVNAYIRPQRYACTLSHTHSTPVCSHVLNFHPPKKHTYVRSLYSAPGRVGARPVKVADEAVLNVPSSLPSTLFGETEGEDKSHPAAHRGETGEHLAWSTRAAGSISKQTMWCAADWTGFVLGPLNEHDVYIRNHIKG